MRATVVIPTHDHGPLLKYAVACALRQTVEGIEILIVGDGVPAEHRQLVLAVAESDPRIRFLDYEKGPRHGEVWRHEALKQASGRIVCYLSDDDLWFPDHVETMESLLMEAEFANTLPVHVAAITNELNTYVVDLAMPRFRQLFHEGHNRVPLTCGGHTLAAYERSAGWRTTPEGTPTDLYMWQELLRSDENRAISGFRVTSLNFPSPYRKNWTLEHRVAELEHWSARISDENQRMALSAQLVESQGRVAATSFVDRLYLESVAKRSDSDLASLADARAEAIRQEADRKAAVLERDLIETSERVRQLEAKLAASDRDMKSLRAALASEKIRGEAAARRRERITDELKQQTAELRRVETLNHEIARSSTWRLREKLSRLRVIGRVARSVARVLAGSGDR